MHNIALLYKRIQRINNLLFIEHVENQGLRQRNIKIYHNFQLIRPLLSENQKNIPTKAGQFTNNINTNQHYPLR
jgi:hypothetical protein